MSEGTCGILLILSAPSGAGKTTLCRSLLRKDQRLSRIVTCTTREPREWETDGIDYHFLDRDTFARRDRQGEFLECAEVYGNRYGTLRSDVIGQLESGRDVLLAIDVCGADQVRACPDMENHLVTVFLAPPSIEELENRLRRRNSEREEGIRRRLDTAEREIRASEAFDYLVVSGSRQRDLQRMRIILEAERLRRHRVRLPVPTEEFRREGNPA